MAESRQAAVVGSGLLAALMGSSDTPAITVAGLFQEALDPLTFNPAIFPVLVLRLISACLQQQYLGCNARKSLVCKSLWSIAVTKP